MASPEPAGALPANSDSSTAPVGAASGLDALRAELRRLRAEHELLEGVAHVGIARIREGRIEQANTALALLTGHDDEVLIGLPVAALQEDPGDAAVFTDEAALGLRGQGRLRLRRADGTLRWVQVSVRAADADDTSAGLVCSFVDVDERERAREALQAGAGRMRSVLDSVLVGIVSVGPHGIEWMNRQARSMFGGDLADYVGEPASVLADGTPGHPLCREGGVERLADAAGGQSFECRVRSREGRVFWVLANAVRSARDGAEGAQVTLAFLDIDARREADAKVARAQGSLRQVIEAAPLAIALFDAGSLRMRQVNQAAAAFFGRPPGQLLDGLPGEWAAGWAGDEAAALRASLQLAADSAADAAADTPNGLHREIARRVASGEGERRWDARFVALPGAPGGEPGQVLMVASDVTDQRRAEQERLEAALAQRDMLVKEVHHRIKNNLQGVAGLLQQSAQRHPAVGTHLSEAVAQVQAIAQVYGLQVGAGGPLHLARLVEAIAASVQRTFGREVQVHVEGEEPLRWRLPEVESIPVALTFNELLTNAVKHGVGAAPVRCHVQAAEPGVAIEFANDGVLHEGASSSPPAHGAHGLGLVRALLPRRSASLRLEQREGAVVARVELRPPGVVRDEAPAGDSPGT